jgi:hypothetical protein
MRTTTDSIRIVVKLTIAGVLAALVCITTLVLTVSILQPLDISMWVNRFEEAKRNVRNYST